MISISRAVIGMFNVYIHRIVFELCVMRTGPLLGGWGRGSGWSADPPSGVGGPLLDPDNQSSYLCIILTVGWLGLVVQPDLKGNIFDISKALSQLTSNDLQ